jgi:hypothetical protein
MKPLLIGFLLSSLAACEQASVSTPTLGIGIDTSIGEATPGYRSAYNYTTGSYNTEPMYQDNNSRWYHRNNTRDNDKFNSTRIDKTRVNTTVVDTNPRIRRIEPTPELRPLH